MILTSRNKTLSLSTPQVMGILNVTPDSFSDGGQFNSIEKALEQAEKMIAAGVTIIDIGGESTRPGASEVLLEEELERTVPVITAIREKHKDIWISIDTSKAEVMRQAVNAGADIINDIRALTEPGCLVVAAELDVPVCLMHMKGQPRTMQNAPEYKDLMQEVEEFLEERINACAEVGIDKSKLILDPGFGFGKTVEHNYELLERLDEFHEFNLPILAGMSRKSMIFKVLDKTPEQSVAGSLACAAIAAIKGAHIIRVHDFEETMDVVKVVNKINKN
ncbi:dihydropteroate synthase [Vibrio hannami]|uniref:dihydropteroate synthase n=1 Tax=Vibrio hannami TaxID=2717094 RepID=UPI00240F6FDE|nr:dihydropteroate synthase [Vibrio hannami]MDG3088927.1 dihydropteroate synthase [Vibrio hannami]